MNKTVVMVIGSVVVAGVSLVVSGVTLVKNHILVKKLNKSIDNVEEATEKKITEGIIEKAVDNAADKHIDEYMKKTESDVLKAASKNLEIQAKNAVEKSANEVRRKTSEEIAKQAAQLDIERLKARICDEAEKHVLEKLDGCMDQYAKKFSDNLDSTQKAYNSLIKVMADKATKEGSSDNSGFRIVLT